MEESVINAKPKRWATREEYNAYMREYMKRWRAKKKKKPEENNDPR